MHVHAHLLLGLLRPYDGSKGIRSLGNDAHERVCPWHPDNLPSAPVMNDKVLESEEASSEDPEQQLENGGAERAQRAKEAQERGDSELAWRLQSQLQVVAEGEAAARDFERSIARKPSREPR
jgi:hypothetical protein